MRIKIFLLFFCSSLVLVGCGQNSTQNSAAANTQINSNQPTAGGSAASNASPTPSAKTEEKTVATGDAPRTVREFFNILPQKYFTLEGCEPQKDKNCERARAELLKNYLEVEDTPNGYLKLSCDGAQSCLRMALFKRPDASYIVAVHTLHEADEINYFLEYKNGAWTDISSKVVPEFSKDLIYELPRVGTTVEVYKKVYPEPQYSERGAKAYELEWKDGKFSVKK